MAIWKGKWRVFISALLPIMEKHQRAHPVKVVVTQFEEVERAATSLGNLPPAPFSILSFLALPVIPELRLTDLGLVDVTAFKLIK